MHCTDVSESCRCVDAAFAFDSLLNFQAFIVILQSQFVIAHIRNHWTDVVESCRCVDAAFAFDSLLNFQAFVVILHSPFVIAHIPMHHTDVVESYCFFDFICPFVIW